jgi:hypothetical protein
LSLSKEDAALLASLPPEVAALLYPEHVAGPLTVTLVYPELDGPARAEAAELESDATEHVVEEPTLPGKATRHRTTFTMRQVEQLHQLYHLLETTIGVSEVGILLSGRRLPMARELWLPLIWTLRS